MECTEKNLSDLNSIELDDQESVIIKVTENDLHSFKRLDHFLQSKIPSLSRSLLKKLFEQGSVTWDDDSPFSDRKISLSKMPPLGAAISINIPPPLPSGLVAENIPLEILYEDEYLLFINKPAGLVVHPAPGNYTGTLVNALLYHCPDLKGIGGVERPGIVHRLDKGTSGVMVVAKEQKCHEGLVLLFSKHQITRKYEALIYGVNLPLQKKLESLIGRHPQHRQKMSAEVKQGKKAITYFKSLQSFPTAHLTHGEMTLETGRTHQIRVHMSNLLQAPLLNDPLYGKPKEQLKKVPDFLHPLLENYPHPFLHAQTLGFIHPITKKELIFSAPAPSPFQDVLQLLKG